jgi:hypothetical protein
MVKNYIHTVIILFSVYSAIYIVVEPHIRIRYYDINTYLVIAAAAL